MCDESFAGSRCVVRPEQHPLHMTRSGAEIHTWPNAAYITPLPQQSKAATTLAMTTLLARITPGTSAAPPGSETPGVPAEAIEAWQRDKGDWVAGATQTLHTFCQHRSEPFTTAEHLWPLLSWPGEMRCFTLAVQTARKSGWMAETGAVRLSGTYATADGHTFAMNKLVPIYTSLITDVPRRTLLAL